MTRAVAWIGSLDHPMRVMAGRPGGRIVVVTRGPRTGPV